LDAKALKRRAPVDMVKRESECEEEIKREREREREGERRRERN
jgi:hypothetical protein